jgi:S1-C subfamily serine protease
MLLGPVPAHWTDSKDKPVDPGLMVLAVEKGSVADKMGITQGAVIKNIAGQRVASIPDLQRVLNDTPSELCKFEVTGPAAPVVASTTVGER